MNDTDAPEVDEATLLALAEEMGLVVAEALVYTREAPADTKDAPSPRSPSKEKTFNLLT